MAAINRFRIFAIAALFVVLFAVCARAEHRRDQILIRYKPGLKAQAQARMYSAQAQAAQSLDQIRYQRYKLPAGLSVDQAIARFKDDPSVEYVGPVNIIRPCREPNDDLYLDGMTITVEDIFGGITTETYTQWWLDGTNGINATQAWDVNTGETSDIIIAIVDSGVRADHEDLAGKMVPGHNSINGEENLTQYDDYGHGTQVAGVAVAMTNNTTGMAGVCWGAKIMPVKIIKVTGYDELLGTPIVSGDDADGAAGIIWAADHGAKIINMSFGGYLSDLSSPDVVIKDAVDYAWGKGCVLVGGSGNDDKEGVGSAFYPACYDVVLSVGATNESGQRCTGDDWDPYGFYELLGLGTPASNFGDWLDVTAPGNNMLSTSITDPGDGYGFYEGALSGTSFATPCVSGVAALVWSHHPDWTNQQVVDRIKATCRDTEADGWDQYTGYGIVDAYGALAGTASVDKTLGELWRAEDGHVSVIDAVVTTTQGDFPDRVFVEQGNRACGIMVLPTTMPESYAEGNKVKIVGNLATITAPGATGGERVIQDAVITLLDSSTTGMLKPLGMPTKFVGGGMTGHSPGVTNGVGVGNAGLLAAIFGKVTSVGWTYFYIDDGSKLRDGSGMRGLKVQSRKLNKPAEGDFVRVTGIVGVEQPQDAGVSIPVIRARRQTDILKMR